MNGTIRALAAVACLIALALGAVACGPRLEPDWYQTEGFGVKPPWRKPPDARSRALAVAVKNAHQNMFHGLLKMRLSEKTTVEQLAVTSPVFDAKLRGLVASLRPTDVQEAERGIVRATVRIDRNKVRRLAREYLPAGESILWSESGADRPDPAQAQGASTQTEGETGADDRSPRSGE